MDLKSLRVQKRLTQWDIRVKTGISQSKLSLIENGYINPSEDEIKKIAQVLGDKPEKIFHKEETSQCA
jgi:transcriptional regulator, XRE family